jgi:hypothetical protein
VRELENAIEYSTMAARSSGQQRRPFNWVLVSEGDCFSPTEAKTQLTMGAPRGHPALIPPLHVLRILPPHPGYARPEECGVQGQTEGLDAEEAGALERVAIGKNN